MRLPCFARKAQELQRSPTDERYSIRASLLNNEDSPVSHTSQDDIVPWSMQQPLDRYTIISIHERQRTMLRCAQFALQTY